MIFSATIRPFGPTIPAVVAYEFPFFKFKNLANFLQKRNTWKQKESIQPWQNVWVYFIK